MAELLFPPMVMGAYQDGTSSAGALYFGVAAEDAQYRRLLLDMAAIVYAADALCERRRLHIPCLRHECPNHSTGLCGGWFIAPPDHNMCGFRASVRALTNLEIAQVAERFMGMARIHDPDSERSFEMSAVFPFPELIEDDHEGLAHRMDEALMLDARDNDAIVALSCPQCHAMTTVKASLRQVRAGFTTNCRCGHQFRVDYEELPVIDYDAGVKREKHY